MTDATTQLYMPPEEEGTHDAATGEQETTPIKTKRRRRKTSEDRESQKTRQARYREKLRQEKEALELQQKQNAADAEAQAQSNALALAQKEKMVGDAIAGTAEILADVVQMAFLDSNAPHLGSERAKLIGTLWAPVLAPYIGENSAQWLPVALAGGGTAQAIFAWVSEMRAYQELARDTSGEG